MAVSSGSDTAQLLGAWTSAMPFSASMHEMLRHNC